MLLGLLTLTPLLWFWTAGDRVVVGRLALLGVCGLPVVGVVLFTVLACGVVTNRMDEHALDGAMGHVSERIAELFDRELGGEIRRLQRAVPRLLARAGRQESSRRGGKIRLRRTAASGGETLTRLERELYCDDADRNLDYDPERPEARSALLLNDEGRQRVCLSEPRRARPARTPALTLEFRDYFTHPKEGVLWRSPPAVRWRPVGCRIGGVQDEESLIPCLVDGLPEPSKRLFGVAGAPGLGPVDAEAPYFLERIDAVVGGRVATILAVNTGLTESPVAVTGVSLNALDRVVPPHHIDFAVVDRETGRTLFHSDDDLAMTSNFVEDTSRDPALWSLLRSGARDTIDLVYTGVPIRAHVRPLRPGLPWTLVVYRGHELEDRLTGLTVALAIFFTLLCLVLVALLAGLVLLALRWCRVGTLRGLPAVLGCVMAVGSRLRGLAGVAVGAALAFLLFGAWLSWLVWTLEGGWRVAPFLAVCFVVAVGVLVVCCALGKSQSTGDRSGGGTTMGRVLGLATLIAALAVAPSVLWFSHHRAALGTGVNHYLVDATLDTVDRAREDYRLEALRRHGTGAAPAGDRTRRRWREEPAPDEGWMQRRLRAVVASSQLANQLMTYRALPPATPGEVASLHGVFARTFGYDIGLPPGVFSAPDFGRLLALAMGLLFFAALLWTHAYSICAACTVVGRRCRGLVELPQAKLLKCLDAAKNAAAERPLRAIVVHRSERCRGDFVRKLAERRGLSRRDHHVERRAGGCQGYVVRWVPAKADSVKAEALHVFTDLKDVLDHSGEGRALLDELETMVKAGSHVLIWSRVVPDYRYSDRFGPADRWFDRGHGDDADRRDRWSSLAREFRSYVLGGSRALEKRCDELVGTTHVRALDEAMRKEVDANPDLLDVARNVSAGVAADVAADVLSAGDARADAVTRFRKCAASSFNQLWTESTRDERLQLYALARGGVVDTRRTAALSSLVNRGLVQVDPDTGMVRLRSEAFREFVDHDVDRHELDAWRKEGGGGGWQFLWPPLAIGGALGLVFLAMANPETRATLLATLLSLVSAALPLLGGGRGAGSAGTTN